LTFPLWCHHTVHRQQSQSAFRRGRAPLPRANSNVDSVGATAHTASVIHHAKDHVKARVTTRIRIALVAGLILAGVALITSSSVLAGPGRRFGHQDFPPGPGATAIICICPPTAPPASGGPPPATAAPRPSPTRPPARPSRPSAAAVLADPYVSALLRGHRVKSATEGVWRGTKGRPLGVTVLARFGRRTTVSGWWLRLWRVPYRETVKNVSGVRALWSSGTRHVVAILPDRS
jgi:hypothetical protein